MIHMLDTEVHAFQIPRMIPLSADVFYSNDYFDEQQHNRVVWSLPISRGDESMDVIRKHPE